MTPLNALPGDKMPSFSLDDSFQLLINAYS